MTIDLTLYLNYYKLGNGHSTKGKVGKWKKTNKQIIYIAHKSPRQNPPPNRIGNKRLNKNNDQWHPI